MTEAWKTNCTDTETTGRGIKHGHPLRVPVRIRKISAFTEASDPACAVRLDAFFLRASAALAVERVYFPAEQRVLVDADSAEESAAAPARADEYSPDDSPPDARCPDDYSARADWVADDSAPDGYPDERSGDDPSALAAPDGSVPDDWLPDDYFPVLHSPGGCWARADSVRAALVADSVPDDSHLDGCSLDGCSEQVDSAAADWAAVDSNRDDYFPAGYSASVDLASVDSDGSLRADCWAAAASQDLHPAVRSQVDSPVDSQADWPRADSPKADFPDDSQVDSPQAGSLPADSADESATGSRLQALPGALVLLTERWWRSPDAVAAFPGEARTHPDAA